MSEKSSTAVGTADQRSKTSSTKAIIAIVITIAALSFVFSNVSPATLRFLFLEFTMPAWAWFLAVLAAGVVIGSLFPWFRPRRR